MPHFDWTYFKGKQFVKNRQRFYRKPHLEVLEDRLLLAGLIDTWIGAISDSYSVAANWDKNQIPGVGDTAILGAKSTQACVLINDVKLADLQIQPKEKRGQVPFLPKREKE